ncbi:MAG TPA: glycoside hydrolase family 16 protein [Verrucomicrobiae bacterium]|nr:glycoside hydrolase family 16 protein [Verrucomicrobiae bacterium]
MITNLPAYGTTASLQGCVLGANPATQSVAVFIYVPGYGWVTKPTCAQPLTAIQSNGSWSANITTGGASDTLATRVAALLVSNYYNQPCVTGLSALPTNIYSLAIAKAVITRASPGVRFLSFSGYDWSVKNSAGTVGPGPNYFSDQTNNVWTDTNGWLHLRITHRTNAWQCAEIISARTFGPGNYRFELNSPVDAINTNVTLGLFTYSDDPAFTDREIDVECGRWENPADTNNAQFVVQPFDGANHLVRYRVPAGLTNTTHLFAWATNQVNFQSQAGAYSAAATNLITSWVFTNTAAVPASGDENVHLNLWLVLGDPPTDNNEVEVVIKSFSFVPLGATPSAILSNIRVPGAGQFRCDFTVQPDFRYAMQTSSNLVQWQQQTGILATNAVFNFADTNTAARTRYYRVVTAP